MQREDEKKLEWTIERPTEAGWYWLYDGANPPSLRYVLRSPLNRAVFIVTGAHLTVDRFIGHWAGPLAPPADLP